MTPPEARPREGEAIAGGATPVAPDAPLYSSRITNTYLKLLRRRYPGVDVQALLAHAGMELHEVEDEGSWFTQRQVNRFQEKLRELTGNPGIAREAGLFSASPAALGGIGRYILGLVTPARAYALTGRFVTRFTRSCTVASRRVGPTSVEIVITPRPGAHEEPFQCENRLGYLESIARHFEVGLRRLEHPECCFRGDPHCRYVITWRHTAASRWRAARLAAVAAGVAALGAVAGGVLSWMHLATLLPASIAAVVLLSLAAVYRENRTLRASVAQLEHAADDLVDEVDLNYRNALTVGEVGQALARERSRDDLLRAVLGILERRLEYDRGVVLLAAEGGSVLRPAAVFGDRPGERELLEREGGYRIDDGAGRGVFARCFRERRPFLVNDPAAAAGSFPPHGLATARRLGVRSFICCPILCEEEALGVLAVDVLEGGRVLRQSDVHLLVGIAAQIGAALRSLRLADEGLLRIRELNAELERRVAARTAALEAANRELESFSYSVSHDLRAPLRAIEGFSRILAEEHGPSLDAEGRRLLGVVGANARRMARLIDDILALSRLGRAERRDDLVDMARLSAEVFGELCPAPERARVSFTVGALPPCRGDAALLRQVWTNLLGNALKFSSKRDRGEIEVGGEDTGGEIVYHVTDNGVGFDMRYADKLFGVFQRLHGPEEFEGTGVGLAIVQRIVRRHGGRVWGRGEPGGGASFSFAMPAGGGG